MYLLPNIAEVQIQLAHSIKECYIQTFYFIFLRVLAKI